MVTRRCTDRAAIDTVTTSCRHRHRRAAIDDRSARGIAAVDRPDDHRRRPRRRHPAADRPRAVAPRSACRRPRVSEAWQQLAAVGAIEARGRHGTFVRAADRARRPAPLPPGHRGPGPLRARPVDRHARPRPAPRPRPDRGPGQPAVADVELPRPPGAAGARRGAATRRGRSRPRRSPSSTARWTPSTASPRSSLRLGDRVVVEHPTFPPLLDLLEQLGCEVDRRRPRRRRAVGSTSCAAALDARRPCRRVFLQPRAHNPTGVAMTARAGRGARRAAGRHRRRSSSRTTTPATSPRRRWSASARGCRTAPCTSAASPRATAPTCAWPRSAAPATSSPPWPTAGCSAPAGRAGSCRRCCVELLARPDDGRHAWPPPATTTPSGAGWSTDVLARARRGGHAAPTGSTCGWRSPTSARRWSPWPRGASAWRRASRSWCAPTATTCASPSACSTAGGATWRRSRPNWPTPPTPTPRRGAARGRLVQSCRGRDQLRHERALGHDRVGGVDDAVGSGDAGDARDRERLDLALPRTARPAAGQAFHRHAVGLGQPTPATGDEPDRRLRRRGERHGEPRTHRRDDLVGEQASASTSITSAEPIAASADSAGTRWASTSARSQRRTRA